MPPTEFVDTPRPPLSVDCDGGMVGPLSAQAWKATFPPANIVLRYAVTTVLGVVVWVSTHSEFLAVAIAVLVPTTVLLVTRARMRRSIRSVAGPGRTLTSGYDADGRFVVERAPGPVVFDAGSVRDVTTTDGVAVVRYRTRQPAFVTDARLLPDGDVAFLTSRSPEGDLVADFRTAHPEVRTPLPVTPAVQQAAGRLMRRALVRHPFLHLALGAFVLIVLVSDHRLRATALVLLCALAVTTILEFGVVRIGTRAIFPEGTVVGAALDEDGVVMHVHGYPAHLGTEEVRSVRSDDDGVVIRTRRQRVHLLPRGTLDPDDTSRLLARTHGSDA